MNFVDMRRNHTKWSIEQNPVEIMINRTERIDKGGYFDEKESPIGPFVVRIYSAKSSSPQTVSTLAGEKQIDNYFGLLADHEVDIQASATVKDEFEAVGMMFEVKAVYPQRIQGQVVGYQCELERVN